ncbi:hypothetical protein ASG87_03260 [Frateuria sp. Soil773]|uniref:helix-turn-helix domain-containing protein n=1 Tax=Frateuria sp. Soil773 TaxID=1736407 RepID=UPI0006FB38A6|nr:helix-turn-helix domain-containing protein [Frateuria sp. Soil773]KRE89372.1 hypothetical protein ASG87_03260 [Frateuria sp. Soil773]
MSYRETLPAPALRTLVAAYWGIDSAPAGSTSARRILPDGCADLICDFAASPPRMRWVGTMTRAIEVPSGGRQALFGIRFAHGALFGLLGAPLSLLTDSTIGVDDLPARRWRPPLDGWCGDRGFAARCARADASLLAVLPRLPSSDTARLLRHLQGRRLLPTATVLGEETGMGLRTLQRRFMDHLGVSPRQHLRYLRFAQARRLLERPGARAADVALAAGYSDQAHFVREFRRFAGVTPGRWR